ncbi:MAG TPA: flagellar assembly protein FliW [Bacteroidota bacterium]|jgi:flagellar assembly factor FliW|nr:flagellar assembly protein FliW [Bacteroidota bacterium]
MKWNNIQFGEFEYEKEHVLHFPEGLFGFEDLHKFILINDEQSEPFLWLVSLEDEQVSFPVLEPHALVPTYSLGTEDKGDTSLLVIVVLKNPLEESTVNMRSPIVIKNATQEGKQIVLENEEYPFYYPLFQQSTESTKG